MFCYSFFYRSTCPYFSLVISSHWLYWDVHSKANSLTSYYDHGEVMPMNLCYYWMIIASQSWLAKPLSRLYLVFSTRLVSLWILTRHYSPSLNSTSAQPQSIYPFMLLWTYLHSFTMSAYVLLSLLLDHLRTSYLLLTFRLAPTSLHFFVSSDSIWAAYSQRSTLNDYFMSP